MTIPHLPDRVTRARRWLARRRRPLAVAVSVAVHGLVVLALLSVGPGERRPSEPRPTTVDLVSMPRPPVAPSPPEPTKPAPAKPSARPRLARPAPAPPDIESLPVAKEPRGAGVTEMGESEVASAATAGSGGGGGACNMLRWLQGKLRKDRLVQAAVAEVHRGRPILVWNGDWIRRTDQDGNGLASVREAIMWEVGFAPEACRKEQVHGLVLISLSDGPGSARLVLGSGVWRWSDLLFSHSAGS